MIFDDIWENWFRGCDECDGCPLRDMRHCYYPFYMGNTSGKVMLIGESPAYNIESMKKRRQKTSNEYTYRPKDWAEMNRRLWSERILSNKNVLINVMMSLVNRTDLSLDDLYFTNLVKCGRYYGCNFDSALDRCVSYLEKEIFVLDPKVVVVFGSKALNTVMQKIYNVDVQLSILQSHGKPIHVDDTNSVEKKVTILPMVHWGYAARNDYILHDVNYFEEISKTFGDFCDNNRL